MVVHSWRVSATLFVQEAVQCLIFSVSYNLLFCCRWPLLVDPDNQGTGWIQQHEATNGLEVVQEQDFNKIAPQAVSGARVTVLEDALTRCVPTGQPLLLLNLSGDPPSLLTSIINRTTAEEGENSNDEFSIIIYK